MRRLRSRSDLLIIGAVSWDAGMEPCSVIAVPGAYCCSLLCWFDRHAVTALHLRQSPLILYRGHELFPSPALSSSTIETTELYLIALAINQTGLSRVTVCPLKKHTHPISGHSEDSVIARRLEF